MNKILTICLAFFLFSANASSEEITQEEKQVIDKILEITQTLEIAKVMSDAISSQLINLFQSQEGFTPQMATIIKEETYLIMEENFITNGWIKETSYPIYHKRFSLKELKEMLAFYQTPTGQKLAENLPLMTQEAIVAGQQHALSLQATLQQRLGERFKAEGL